MGYYVVLKRDKGRWFPERGCIRACEFRMYHNDFKRCNAAGWEVLGSFETGNEARAVGSSFARLLNYIFQDYTT